MSRTLMNLTMRQFLQKPSKIVPYTHGADCLRQVVMLCYEKRSPVTRQLVVFLDARPKAELLPIMHIALQPHIVMACLLKA
jgi:hypothetical protein